MRKLALNKQETLELLRNGVILIERNGFEILVEIKDDDYIIMVVNPYDKVLLAKEFRK